MSAVGCKIRLGLNSQEQEQKVYLRVVEAANGSGLDYLTVHARHAKQRSRDLPTWSSIQGSKQQHPFDIINTPTPRYRYPHIFILFCRIHATLSTCYRELSTHIVMLISI